MESHKEKWLLSGKKSKSYQNHKLQQNAKRGIRKCLKWKRFHTKPFPEKQ